VAGVADLTRERDEAVIGSTSVVHALAAADAVDEYRLLVIPTALAAVSDCSSRPSTCTSSRSRPWVRQSWRATTAPPLVTPGEGRALLKEDTTGGRLTREVD